MDLINSTRNIQWNKLATDIQFVLNENLKLTREFVSDKVLQNNLFTATLLSLIFVVFYWSIIYLDSSQPGVNPPTPFSAISKQRFRNQRKAHFHLNYITGALIGGLLFISIYFKLFD